MRLTPDDRQLPPGPNAKEPPAGGSVPALARGGVATSLTMLLNIVSLALAVGMIVTLFYISQSVQRVAQLEDRLSGLTQFEGRLSGQIDTVNQGFHSQFDEMGKRVAALSRQVAALEKQLQALEAQSRAMAAGLSRPGIAAAGAEPAPPAQGREVVLSAPPPPAEEEPEAAPEAESGAPAETAAEGDVRFRRVETPDGKVTYSRVR